MISSDVVLGKEVVIPHPELVNLYGCRIGDESKIASFVEIQRGVTVGRRVKIEAFAFLPTGLTLGNGVFVGPHVTFTNDRYPASVAVDGSMLRTGDWTITPTEVCDGAVIGANATIVCGVTIGAGAMVAAGAVVTKDVPAGTLVAGSPARVVGPVPRHAND